MEFDSKIGIVRYVQRLLGVSVDGKAGKVTWRTIEGRITGKNVGTNLNERIRNVQRFLKLKDDGIDGPATWNAIKNHLSVQSQQPTTNTIPSKTGYPERVQLSQQTTGPRSQKITPSAIVLHHTSGNYDGSVAWTNRVFDEKGGRLYASYHCIIARDGRRTITNEDTNRAYHAGASSFKGRSSLNTWSLGVAWERDTYSEPLSNAAIESALEYILPRMKKWNITPDNVTDHRTVSPGRKSDIALKEYEKFMKILRERWEKY
jgi:N-acetyl-anhydromuramyl-L-alanine amidase AmpD